MQRGKSSWDQSNNMVKTTAELVDQVLAEPGNMSEIKDVTFTSKSFFKRGSSKKLPKGLGDALTSKSLGGTSGSMYRRPLSHGATQVWQPLQKADVGSKSRDPLPSKPKITTDIESTQHRVVALERALRERRSQKDKDIAKFHEEKNPYSPEVLEMRRKFASERARSRAEHWEREEARARTNELESLTKSIANEEKSIAAVGESPDNSMPKSPAGVVTNESIESIRRSLSVVSRKSQAALALPAPMPVTRYLGRLGQVQRSFETLLGDSINFNEYGLEALYEQLEKISSKVDASLLESAEREIECDSELKRLVRETSSIARLNQRPTSATSPLKMGSFVSAEESMKEGSALSIGSNMTSSPMVDGYTSHCDQLNMTWSTKFIGSVQPLSAALDEIALARKVLGSIFPHIELIDNVIRKAHAMGGHIKRKRRKMKPGTRNVALQTDDEGTARDNKDVEMWTKNVEAYSQALDDIEEENEDQNRSLMENLKLTRDLFVDILKGDDEESEMTMMMNRLGGILESSMLATFKAPMGLVASGQAFYVDAIEKDDFGSETITLTHKTTKKAIERKLKRDKKRKAIKEAKLKEKMEAGEDLSEWDEPDSSSDEDSDSDWETEYGEGAKATQDFEGIRLKRTRRGGKIGWKVTHLKEGSMGESAGLKEGSVIFAFDSVSADEFNVEDPKIQKSLFGSSLHIIFSHKGRLRTTTLCVPNDDGYFENPTRDKGVLVDFSAGENGDSGDGLHFGVGGKDQGGAYSAALRKLLQYSDQDLTTFYPESEKYPLVYRFEKKELMSVPSVLARFASKTTKMQKAAKIKPAKMTLPQLSGVIMECLFAKIGDDSQKDLVNHARLDLMEFLGEFLLMKYGFRKLAEERLIEIIKACEQMRFDRPIVAMFAKFVGLYDLMPAEWTNITLRILSLIRDCGIVDNNNDGVGQVDKNIVMPRLKDLIRYVCPNSLDELEELMSHMLIVSSDKRVFLRVDDLLAVSSNMVVSEWAASLVLLENAFNSSDAVNHNGVLDYEEFSTLLGIIHETRPYNVAALFKQTCDHELRQIAANDEAMDADDFGVRFSSFYTIYRNHGAMFEFLLCGKATQLDIEQRTVSNNIEQESRPVMNLGTSKMDLNAPSDSDD